MVLIHGNNSMRIVSEFAMNSPRRRVFVQKRRFIACYNDILRRRILCVQERCVFESRCCRCIAIVFKFGSLKMASNFATYLSIRGILNAWNLLDSEILQHSRRIPSFNEFRLHLAVYVFIRCCHLHEAAQQFGINITQPFLVNSWRRICKKNRINSNSKNARKIRLRSLFTANSRKMRMLIFQCRC